MYEYRIRDVAAKRTTPMTKHPLAGKLISINDDDRGTYCISRFTAEVAPGLMLARRLNPRTGEEFAESHIINLVAVAEGEFTTIFDSWDDCKTFYHCPHTAEKHVVVKLVPKEPQ